jgi:hypothetical protein
LTTSARAITVGAVSLRFYIPSALLSVVVALTVAAGASAAGPVASASATCTPPKYPGSGYFTSLSVTKTSCATGSKIAKAYYKCRTAKGPSGRCVKKVDGYSCQEKRKSIATEINATVTCKKGSATVKHSYQQNLD